MEVSNAMRLRQLEGENARLRKMVVEQAVVEFATAFPLMVRSAPVTICEKGHLRFTVRRTLHLVSP